MTTSRPRLCAVIAFAVVFGCALVAQAADRFAHPPRMIFQPRLPRMAPFTMRLPEAIPRVPRTRIVPIPTKWDAKAMLIPTTWQARIMLLKGKP